MSKTVEELKLEVKKVGHRIDYYSNKLTTLNNELVRLHQQIYGQSVQEMTIAEIEAKLGHKVKIK